MRQSTAEMPGILRGHGELDMIFVLPDSENIAPFPFFHEAKDGHLSVSIVESY